MQREEYATPDLYFVQPRPKQ